MHTSGSGPGSACGPRLAVGWGRGGADIVTVMPGCEETENLVQTSKERKTCGMERVGLGKRASAR